MKRYFEALRPVELPVAISSVPDGLFLVRIARAQYRWHRRNPYYDIRFAVLKPKHLTGSFITGRLECNRKAMWKVGWFLREFGYDPELLGRGEIDEQALVDLWGVVKISHALVRGIPALQLDAFSSADRWEEPAGSGDENSANSEAAS